MKLCKACGQEKPITEFHKDKSKSDGLNAYCKPCTRERQKAFQAKPPRYQATDGLKRCQHCKEEKPYAEFHKSKGAYDGLKRVCKACAFEVHSNWRRNNKGTAAENSRKWRAANPERSADHCAKAAYGIPLGTYQKLFEEQQGKCGICETTVSGGRGRFHIDHCHDGGHVRGLLCHHCNIGIGNLKHDPRILLAAISYLGKTTRT